MTRNRALRAEWRHLGAHRVLLISIIVILFIPIMYGGFFLGSIWDPYGNTKHLPVAIVNEDEGAVLNGTTLHVGADLVDTLKSNDDMGWRFVSAKEAKTGIDDGSYYMALTIPKDFSQHVATVTSKNPQKSTIAYVLTPARNYVASLLTKQAAEQIATTVSTSVSKAYVSAVFDSVRELQVGLQDASNGASDLVSGSHALSAGITAYASGVAQLQAGQTTLNDGIGQITHGSSSLTQGLAKLRSGLPSTSDIAQLKAGIASVQSGIATLNAGLQHPDATLTAQQAQVLSDVSALQNDLTAYSLAMTAAQPDVATLETAIMNSQTTATVDAQHVLTLVTTSNTVVSHAANLLVNLGTFTTTLSTQQGVLAASVSTLNSGMTALTPQVTSALNGFTSISGATDQLSNGATTLYLGSTQALSGSNQLVSGTAQLTASSAALTDGATQLAMGSQKLSAGLSSAAAQLALQPTTDASIGQIVTPVTTEKTERGDVPNYGFALSPYVLSLGLFVGALVFNVIYPVRRFFDEPKSAREWWAAKMSTAFMVAVGQALILDAIMIFGLGLQPDNPVQFVLLSVVTSMAYMSIVTLLAVALDNVGRFIAMLLLVLQLGSAEGVFPIVLSPVFFQIIHPFVPMTYSIYAFREAISSGVGTDVYWKNTGVLLAIIVVMNLLMMLFFRLHGMRHFRHESIDADDTTN